MRRFAIAYTAFATWAFGWMVGRFLLLPSLLAAIILFSPALFAWRMLASSRSPKRREYVYLSVVTLLAVCGTTFVALQWLDKGMDRAAMFDREFHQFKSHIAGMPEYKNVNVSFTHRKGGRVYLNGQVSTKDAHDRLLRLYARMVRNNESGCYDGIAVHGKATGQTALPADQQEDEPSDAAESR